VKRGETLLRYKEIFLGNSPCSNTCLYCPIREKDSSKTDLHSILSSLRQRTEENVAFYGGDPALRKDLFEIIRAAKNNGYRRIKLFTNGRAFSDRYFLDQVITAGCSLFEIPLWGSHPSLHDHLTQAPGSFHETLRGLENLAGISHDTFVCVRIPLSVKNYTDGENIVALALGLNINRIILSMQDSGLSFRSAFPHIKNAINISIFNRIWAQTEGIPFCIMQGLEQHIGEILSGRDTICERTFRYHDSCMQCTYKDICPGTEAEYLQQFGDDEFSPVKADKYSQEIRALHE
jgi:MoaA/NifB/PqqE/SkfB family radical SAM enzyme